MAVLAHLPRVDTLEDKVNPVRVALTLLGLLLAAPALAQAPSSTLAQLGGLVEPVALYPDPLLAQVLAAATFYDQLPEAARWADQHRNLTDVKLANAMRAADVPANPIVAALLPFPVVLNKMVLDPDRTRQLGEAFLAQQLDVLKAVQGERVKAKDFGYLRSNQHFSVGSPPYVTISPTNPADIFVPSYDPTVVFSTPSPGLEVADAIRFDSHVSVGGFQLSDWHFEKFQVIGGYFQAWGWGLGGIDWPAQKVIINGSAWQRNLANRGEYVHRYTALQRFQPAK
jgi:hypothetical protein